MNTPDFPGTPETPSIETSLDEQRQQDAALDAALDQMLGAAPDQTLDPAMDPNLDGAMDTSFGDILSQFEQSHHAEGARFKAPWCRYGPMRSLSISVARTTACCQAIRRVSCNRA
jgi:hypothetical protein